MTKWALRVDALIAKGLSWRKPQTKGVAGRAPVGGASHTKPAVIAAPLCDRLQSFDGLSGDFGLRRGHGWA